MAMVAIFADTGLIPGHKPGYHYVRLRFQHQKVQSLAELLQARNRRSIVSFEWAIGRGFYTKISSVLP